jgi:hypothetical protein
MNCWFNANLAEAAGGIRRRHINTSTEQLVQRLALAFGKKLNSHKLPSARKLNDKQSTQRVAYEGIAQTCLPAGRRHGQLGDLGC